MDFIVLNETRQLLVDNYIIENMKNTDRIIHKWKEDKQNPVFVKKYEWEGIGPYVLQIIKDDNYKMYYATFDKNGKYNIGFAESKDGLEWKRYPDMIPEGKMGNVVLDPKRRHGEYKFFSEYFLRPEGNLPARNAFSHSKDGINWENFEGNPWWEGPSDVLCVMWDSQKESFVSYHKVWRITGTTLDGRNIKVYLADYLSKKELNDDGDYVITIEGKELFPELHPVTYKLLSRTLGKDDGGGGIVTSDVAMLRVIGRAESMDFINWEKHQIVLEPEEDDAEDVQYYGMPVFQYQNSYIGLPKYFEALSGMMHVRFAYSRDGINFNIPDKKLVMEPGAKGSWDFGMQNASADILEVDDRLCMYYGGINVDHTCPIDSHYFTVAKGATGRAWLRKDGFASLTGGTVRTKPLLLKGKDLFINASGRINIRILDLDGNLVGRAFWEGNSVSSPVALQSGGILDIPLRIEFDLEDGNLYSFWSE